MTSAPGRLKPGSVLSADAVFSEIGHTGYEANYGGIGTDGSQVDHRAEVTARNALARQARGCAGCCSITAPVRGR